MHRLSLNAAVLTAALMVFCALGWLSPRALAQTSTTGALAGVVTDPSGAVVPKADVQLVNADTNAVEKQLTNDAGQFIFASLTPGTYKIPVQTAGFRTPSLTGVLAE